MCSGCNQHVLHELNTTSSSRWSSNTPGQGNSIPLNAERVSCTEKTLKKNEWDRHTAKVELFRARSNRHEQFHRGVRFQASRYRHHRTSCVPTSSVQIWLLKDTPGFGTLQLSFLCLQIDLCIGEDSMSNRGEQNQDTVLILSSRCRQVIRD